MRYRPFGRSGMATSAIALNLSDATARKGREHVRTMIHAALEHGINAYYLASCDPELPAWVGDALSPVERRLVMVGMKLGMVKGRLGLVRDFSPETLTAMVDHALNASGLGHIDLAVLDSPGDDELSRPALDALKGARASGRLSVLGVAGNNDSMDAYVSANAFDVLVTPYSLRSGWKERNRLKAAQSLDMGVISYDWYPEEFTSVKKTEQTSGVRRGLFGGPKEPESNPLAGMGTYTFLHQTRNWTAEEICLAYALTEPTLSTVLVECTDPQHLASLAAVPDRDMPPGLGAQVEMARFGVSDQKAG